MLYSRRFLHACALAVLYVIAGCSGEQGAQPRAEEPERDDPESEQQGIRSVRLLPDEPRGAVTLEAEVLFWGPDPEKLHLSWLRDGEPIAGETSPTLAPSHFRKGDSISLGVEAEWKGGLRASRTSAPVVIGNVAPRTNRIEIQPRSPGTSDDLTAVVHSCDFDGDELGYAYEWLVNGKRVPGNDAQTLSHSFFLRGDRVEVSGTPFDGRDRGETLHASIQIRNSAPKIVSAAPVVGGPGPYRYPVEAVDPDGDVPRFRLEGMAPVGMRIDAETGVIQGEVPVVAKSVRYAFNVVAEDGEGAKDMQEITVELTPPASAPGETDR